MGRNYGLGTRNMEQAGSKALARACSRGELSFSSVATVADRWAIFCRFAKAKSIGRMERVTPELLRQYGQGLAHQVRGEEMSASYAQNLVSAVNTVMRLVRCWPQVSPTIACGICERSNVRGEPPGGIDRAQLARATRTLREAGHHRGAATAELAREFGLRSKEASLLNVQDACLMAQSDQQIIISAGTKGGKVRKVPIVSTIQLDTLHKASVLQGGDRALLPASQNWKQWREGELRLVREVLQTFGIRRLHDLRAAYACERYKELTGHMAPVFSSLSCDRGVDLSARKIISQELGHGAERTDVVVAYIGGR